MRRLRDATSESVLLVEGVGSSAAAAAIPRSDGTPTSAAVVLFDPANRLTEKMIERVAPLVVHAASEIASRMLLAG